MPKIDYSEWTELSAEITTQRLKIVSQFKSFNQAQQHFKGATELSGTGWDSSRDYFDGYITVSEAIFNALYEVDDATTEYVSAFTSEVGAAENQLDTDHLERLKSELRSLQAENDILMEVAAKAFENIPFINKFFMERSMLGKAKEIEILEKYQAFEATHGSDFAEVQSVISSIEHGLALLGNSGNFIGGANGYKKISWKEQDWFKTIQAFNEKNKEDRYEIVVIHEDHDGKQFAIYKNGKLDEGRTLDYNKLLGKQDWEMLMKLGPETIKMLLNLDDVEVLLDDGSSTGQKVKSSIFLILAITPADKVKDLIRAAKLLKRGDHVLDGVKLTAKELDMLRDLEKSGERVKIVEKGSEVGKINVDFAKVTETATLPKRGGETVVGHALQKHAGRNPSIWGGVKGNSEQINKTAMNHLNEIMNAQGKFKIAKAKNGVNFLEKWLPDGRGIRLNMDGTFKGFID
ncbi:T7SS effector LXG polymorphic toxin [Enterococcus ureasiticus]|uniref:T7SS effector LXG polymorphic toxin n=1 Tax=Enterococcus ureasiticus TaxID=903984 RepID=UPI001F5FB43E|nr:T7SS effector LXG polymorphic toxin [Enterococcus ureasiticus]